MADLQRFGAFIAGLFRQHPRLSWTILLTAVGYALGTVLLGNMGLAGFWGGIPVSGPLLLSCVGGFVGFRVGMRMGGLSVHPRPVVDDAPLKPARPVGLRFEGDKFWVDLSDSRTLGVPLSWFPILAEATPEQRLGFRFSRRGLHWEELDEDISVEGLLAGRGDMTNRSKRKVAAE